MVIKLKKLHFIDSCQFIPASLDSLVKSFKIEAKAQSNYEILFKPVHDSVKSHPKYSKWLKDIKWNINDSIMKWGLKKGHFP